MRLSLPEFRETVEETCKCISCAAVSAACKVSDVGAADRTAYHRIAETVSGLLVDYLMGDARPSSVGRKWCIGDVASEELERLEGVIDKTREKVLLQEVTYSCENLSDSLTKLHECKERLSGDIDECLTRPFAEVINKCIDAFMPWLEEQTEKISVSEDEVKAECTPVNESEPRDANEESTDTTKDVITAFTDFVFDINNCILTLWNGLPANVQREYNCAMQHMSAEVSNYLQQRTRATSVSAGLDKQSSNATVFMPASYLSLSWISGVIIGSMSHRESSVERGIPIDSAELRALAVTAMQTSGVLKVHESKLLEGELACFLRQQVDELTKVLQSMIKGVNNPLHVEGTRQEEHTVTTRTETSEDGTVKHTRRSVSEYTFKSSVGTSLDDVLTNTHAAREISKLEGIR